MIKLTNVEFFYNKGPQVFECLTAEFCSGMLHGVLGQNGAGKSTLYDLLAGLTSPKSGELLMDRTTPYTRSIKSLSSIALLPEHIPTSKLSIESYAAIYSPFWPLFSQTDFIDKLSKFSVKADVPLPTLSYGQRKKALLAFLLSTGAKCLLLDEPTNGLDIDARAALRDMLLDYIAPDKIVMIATHSLRDFDNLFDHITILNQGRVAIQADVHHLSDSFAFAEGQVVPTEAIHAVRRPGGFAYLLPNNDSHTQPDLELLYQAVLAKPECFTISGGHQ